MYHCTHIAAAAVAAGRPPLMPGSNSSNVGWLAGREALHANIALLFLRCLPRREARQKAQQLAAAYQGSGLQLNSDDLIQVCMFIWSFTPCLYIKCRRCPAAGQCLPHCMHFLRDECQHSQGAR